ncbi:MAG: hypothetical protein U0271_05480 [Polyangiaceae bacterium]
MTDIRLDDRPPRRTPDDETQTVLLVHAVLVGLTPLIPIPILDDAVKGYVERRVVLELGKKHGVLLGADVVSALVDDPSGSVLSALAQGAIQYPLKLLLRKLFFVLEVKRASDAASLAYHRGYLVERALALKLLEPLGPYRSPMVRSAIDWACQNARISPLTSVMAGSFEGSRAAMEALGKGLIKRLRPKRGATGAQAVEGAVEDASRQGPIAGVVEQLRRGLRDIPAEHFANLEQNFDACLADQAQRAR